MARSPLKPADQADPYDLADRTYDPDRVYSHLGEISDYVKARVDSKEIGRIQKLVEQRAIPEYMTMSDFIRDAIYHRLRWVDQFAPDPALHRVLNAHAFSHDAEQRKDRIKAEKKAIEDAREVFQLSLGHRDEGMFDEQMAAAEQASETMVGQYQDDMRALIKTMKAEAKKVKW